jgi:hypothetical protein
MQFAATSTPAASEETVRALMSMIQNEPVVRQVLRLVQNHCLSGGLHLRFGHDSNVPPTPLFARHVEHYYTQFCRNAIVSFLAVGFVPYRIRSMRDAVQIPEVLPLGTYSWRVTRSSTPLRSTVWHQHVDGRVGLHPPHPQRRRNNEEADTPLLRIEVVSALANQEVFVYEFEPLNALFPCASVFASLIPGYFRLLHKRECVRRADEFNSHCSLVLEQVERNDMHTLQNSSAVMLNMGNEAQDQLRSVHQQGEGRQLMLHHLVRAQQALPDESSTLIAPVNQSVRALDRVLSPQEMVREELLFMRSVACAVGIPPTLVLQGSGAVGSNSASTSSNAQGWAESSENNNRELLDLCRHINSHLELLMLEAYEHIYGLQGGPQFRIVALPIFNLEQLQVVFRDELIDDGAFSAILEASWGTPLGQHAVRAR